MNDDRFGDWDAAYVLGLLRPEDRRAYEDHLATCDACSAAVAELAGIPGILGTLSTAEAVALLDAPEPDESGSNERVQQLAVAVGRRRRRIRLAVAGVGLAAAAALGIGGYVVGAANEPTASAGGPFVAMSQAQPGIMSANLRVEKKGWGTRFDWSCHYLATGAYQDSLAYELVVIDRAGHETIAATWTAASPRTSALVASSSVPTATIDRVEIRAAGATDALTSTTL